MAYVLPPVAMWASYVAMGGLVVGFFAAIAGLMMAIPHLTVGGGKTLGERAYRFNQRHADFYTQPKFKRERLLVLGGFGTFLTCMAFILFLMLAFGEPVPKLA